MNIPGVRERRDRSSAGGGRAGHRRTHAGLGAALVGVALGAGCGSSTTSACGASVPAAVAAVVGASSAAAEVQSDSPGSVTCVYKATTPDGGQPEAMSVTVVSGPRAYVDFTTTITHLVQFPSQGQAPRQVSGVARSADWLSGPRELLAATAKRFVRVKVLAHGSGAPPDLDAARRVARATLR